MSNEAVETEQHGPFRIEIHYDTDPGFDPIREDDDECVKMNVYFGRDGDAVTPSCKHERGDPKATDARLADSCYQFPVFAFIHGGVTIRVTRGENPFHCPWDSGQCGTVHAVKSFFDDEDAAYKACEAVVAEADEFIRGEVYGFRTIDSNGEEIDSCWGFIGEAGKQQALEEARAACKAALASREDVVEALAVD